MWVRFEVALGSVWDGFGIRLRSVWGIGLTGQCGIGSGLLLGFT